jgi:D-amino-acid dehydrogenase
VTPDEAAVIDPVYEPVRDRFAGALYAPGDESGDARLFTRNLARVCSARGAELRMAHTIERIEHEGGRVRRVVTDKGPLEADAYVPALGCYSAPVGRAIGLDLPICPVKGYSVTLPIEGRNNPPTLSGVDEDSLFAFANYGDRVRMTGIAELAGYDWSHRPEDFRTMLAAARRLFPDAGNYERAEYWAGLRPMTPDTLPFVGPTPYETLWLDSAHGHMGWTWACGTARIVADLMAGKRPDIDPGAMLLR